MAPWRRIASTKQELDNTILKQLGEKLNPAKLSTNDDDLIAMKGASNWLKTFPENIDLNKRKFYVVLSLSYLWKLKCLSSTYPCGKRFDVDQVTTYMTGGFVRKRNDEARDLFSSLLKDLYHDDEVERHLQTLTREIVTSSASSSDKARLDVSGLGFRRKGKPAIMSVFLTLLLRDT